MEAVQSVAEFSKEVKDVACIMIIEDALSKAYLATESQEVKDSITVAGAYLLELKDRIRKYSSEEDTENPTE